MYVCEKCHKTDEKITKCTIPFAHHHAHIRSTCDVCGKMDTLAECWAYGFKLGISTRSVKCSSVKNVMNATE